MKAEEDAFLIEIKSDLLGVEASLLPIDSLYKDAQKNHDEAKVKSYEEVRAKLIASRDLLHKEIEELEASDELFAEQNQITITKAWKALKGRLVDIVSLHGE